MGKKEKKYLPHAVTVNEYLERLEPDELQKVQQKQVYGLIRSKMFYDARFRKKWLVIADETQTYSGNRKLHDGCLERHYSKGTKEETVNYHCDVLEAKIVLGESVVIRVASEFIENNGENAEAQKGLSEEKRKQETSDGHLPGIRITKKNAEKLAGAGHGAEEPLPDDTDIGYGETAV